MGFKINYKYLPHYRSPLKYCKYNKNRCFQRFLYLRILPLLPDIEFRITDQPVADIHIPIILFPPIITLPA